MTVAEPSGRRVVLRFSTRTVLAIVMLAAAYFAGWVSHREWNMRNIDEAVVNAARRIQTSVDIETPTPELIVLTGREDDVENMQEAIRDIDNAARK